MQFLKLLLKWKKSKLRMSSLLTLVRTFSQIHSKKSGPWCLKPSNVRPKPTVINMEWIFQSFKNNSLSHILVLLEWPSFSRTSMRGKFKWNIISSIYSLRFSGNLMFSLFLQKARWKQPTNNISSERRV